MRRTIIVTGARAPSALHLARLFHCAGHRVILADTFRYPISRATRMKDCYVRLPSPRQSFSDYAVAIADLVARESPDLIVPTCEEVFFLAAVRDRRGIDMPLFAPDFDLLAKVHNKADFAEMAAGLGADPPRTWRLNCCEDLSGLSTPAGALVFKPAWSRFGSRVLIRPSEADIQKLRPTEADPWVAQAYLPGEEELLGARWPFEFLAVPEVLYRPVGCRNCANTGYHGRIALHEVMPISAEIESLTVRRVSSNEIREVALAQGMYDLRSDGLAKAAGGLTSVREVSRVAI